MLFLAKKYLKIPLTILLTLGACLLLGLLSFGGMYALWPLLSISIAAMILSVLYEGEIYKKNIDNALNKLLDKNFTTELLGEEYLKQFDWNKKNLPSFFEAYSKLSKRKVSPAQEKRLKIMHIWLGQLLIHRNSESIYAQKIIHYLNQTTQLENLKDRAKEIRTYNTYVQIFSALAAGLMSLGTIFLILEVLPVLPFLSISPTLLPYIVFPMASFSGIAYGFLTYNSLTDFLLKNNLQVWFKDIKYQFTVNRPWENGRFVIFSAFIFILNLTLTLCTAGTWWTVVSSSQSSWTWLKHPLTKGVSSLIAPIVSVSTLGFNLENTIETINEINDVVQPKNLQHNQEINEASRESYTQLFNPFRILIKMIYTPILIVLFLGHLIGIGLTADRMPGVPAIVSTLLGMISEGFEDFHYFFDLEKLLNRFTIFFKIITSPFVAIGFLVNVYIKPKNEALSSKNISTELLNIFSEGFREAFAPESTHQNCAHTHHHEHSDIPSKVLQMFFMPLFALSALWHYVFQDQTNHLKKSFKECFDLQLGWDSQSENGDFDQVQSITTYSWLRAEAQFKISEHIEYLKEATINPKLADQKSQDLKIIFEALNSERVKADDIIPLTQANSFDQNRFFKCHEKTETRTFLDEMIKNLTTSKILDCCVLSTDNKETHLDKPSFNILNPKGKFVMPHKTS